MIDRKPQASDTSAEQARDAVDAVYRSESRRVFATLIRLVGDFDIAEEALHEAFRAALEQGRAFGSGFPFHTIFPRVSFSFGSILVS